MDLEEKVSQVSMMGRVFSLPKQVIAWLGSGDERTEKAVAFVKTIYKRSEKRKNNGERS